MSNGRKLVDVVMKLLQGEHFRRMRAMLMNITVYYGDEEDCSRMNPDLLPREEETVEYAPASSTPEVSSRSNTNIVPKPPGKDRRSVLGDSKITNVSTSKLYQLAKKPTSPDE